MFVTVSLINLIPLSYTIGFLVFFWIAFDITSVINNIVVRSPYNIDYLYNLAFFLYISGFYNTCMNIYWSYSA